MFGLSLVTLSASLAGALSASTLVTRQDTLFTPCTWPGLSGEVHCARIDVPENPDRPTARRLGIQIVVARATTPTRAPDPLVFLAGGPGQAGTEMGAFATEAFSRIREHRDVVLVDYRGTGRSAPLHCRLFRTAKDLGGATTYPPESIRHCRDSLSQTADVRQYTTGRIVDDLETVRRRLRWPAVNLYGTSYGSRVAFEWMRRHPNGRHVVLQGVAHGWWNVAACGAEFAAQFVEQASARGIDVSCAERSSAPTFAVPRR